MTFTARTVRFFQQRRLLLLPLGLLLTAWLLNTPAGVLGKADALGYAVCHRIAERSFHFADGRALPLCVRCSGMYLGAVLGLVFQFLTAGRRSGFPSWKMMILPAGLVLAFAVDGVNSYLALFLGRGLLYEPNHVLRLLTGTGMGLVIAIALFPAFNDTIWAAGDARPALVDWRHLVGLLGLAVGLDLLVLTEHWLVLYPLAWVSAAGVLLMLTLIYLVAVVLLLRQEGRFQVWRQLMWPGLAAFTVALLQVAVFDFVRYAITGTWNGFFT